MSKISLKLNRALALFDKEMKLLSLFFIALIRHLRSWIFNRSLNVVLDRLLNDDRSYITISLNLCHHLLRRLFYILLTSVYFDLLNPLVPRCVFMSVGAVRTGRLLVKDRNELTHPSILDELRKLLLFLIRFGSQWRTALNKDVKAWLGIRWWVEVR